MISTVLLGIVWVTIFGTYYGIFRYRGRAARYWGWNLASAVAWTAYGISTINNGWNSWWHAIWVCLVFIQAFNAVKGYAIANREKAEGNL